ncbi:MAG: ATP-binding protein [Spirochaetales bacterium]
MKPTRTYSLRSALLFSTLGIILLASTTVYVLSLLQGRHAVTEMASRLGGEVNLQIQSDLQEFLSAPVKINQVNAAALARGQPNPADQELLLSYFWNQLQMFDSVNSIYFGNPQGGLANSGREGSNGSQYVIRTEQFQAGVFNKFAVDSNGKPTVLVSSLASFDSRTRSWFLQAAQSGRAGWTAPYVLFTGQDLAVSAFAPVFDSQWKQLGVVGVDVFLSHLGSLLASLKVGKTGQSFVLETSGLLVATSTGEVPFSTDKATKTFLRRNAAESVDPVLRSAYQSLTGNFGTDLRLLKDGSPQSFEFPGQNGRFLGQASLLPQVTGLPWVVVTLLPENDFLGLVNQEFAVTGLVILTILLLTLLANQWMTRRMTRPLAELTRYVESFTDGEWTLTLPPAGRIRELRILNDSFRIMAQRLLLTVDELVVAKDKAEVANRLKSEFVQNVSHEMRTPLASVIGFSELLLQGELSQTQRNFAALVRRNGNVLRRQIEGLLDFSRLESGTLSLTVAQTALAPLLLQVNSQTRQLATNHGLEFQLTLKPGIPAQVEVDGPRLVQILDYLLENAVKFTRSGRVELSVEAEQHGPLAHLLFRIQDTGVGIPEDKLASLWLPLTQVDGSPTREHGGIGLGLSLSRRLVELMGGSLGLTSQPGVGTTVSFGLEVPALWDSLLEPPDVVETPQASDDRGSPSRSARIPDDLAQRLRAAAAGGDIKLLYQLCDLVALTGPEEADSLRSLLGQFDYDGLDQWLNSRRLPP